MHRLLRIWAPLALLATSVAAQEAVTLEQATSRAGPEMAAFYEGRTVSVRAQVTAGPVWALGTYYLPVRDATDHGLLLRGERDQFSNLAPGDWIEVQGTIQSRAAMPLLAPTSIVPVTHEAAPDPKDLSVAELSGFRYLGLIVRTTATVTGVAENLGGKSLEVSDHGNTIAVFLPRPLDASSSELRRVRVGDHVRLTGLATQYSLEPPHNSGFQLMLAAPEDVEIVAVSSMPSPWMWLGALVALGLVAGAWWVREHRLSAQRSSMRAFHALSEEIISAASPEEIAEKLTTVLPQVSQATGVRLFIFDRRAKALKRMTTLADPDPMMVPLDEPADGLAGGALVCFRNRTSLNVPDTRRSPVLNLENKTNLPRSAMFVPLFSQNDVLGVLEISNARRVGFFTVEERASIQHLANQVAASLKLQAQQTIREQLFRSEKLAATGQLISGVASELRAPLESISRLAQSLMDYQGRTVPERVLRGLGGEAERASEIVSRLVSFARPEDSAARQVDVNALVAGLIQFREPEWKTLGLRGQNRLASEAALVLGAQGQIEQVFLNLLVHAEQCAADAPGKTIAVTSSMISRRVTVEISYSVQEGEAADLFSDAPSTEGGALGLGVCRGIIQSHGGEIRFGSHHGTARFEVDLPVALLRNLEEPERTVRASRPASTLTIMVVDPDPAAQRQLLGLLGSSGHRVIPAPVEEAADLAQRLRFDAVFWATRPSTSRAAEYQERIRDHVPVFVLVTDVWDSELARSLESTNGFLLVRPIQPVELERILQEIDEHSPVPRPAG